MQQFDPLKAVEDPTQGRMIRWLVELVRNRLARFDQAHAEPLLGQAIASQTQDHHQAQRHDPLRLLEEDGGGQE
jgi:hypothetical protein